jgi:hypothetical protein
VVGERVNAAMITILFVEESKVSMVHIVEGVVKRERQREQNFCSRTLHFVVTIDSLTRSIPFSLQAHRHSHERIAQLVRHAPHNYIN